MRAALSLAGFFGLTSVAIGAYGAHGLHDKLIAADMLEPWQTAVHYQMTHALALLAVAALYAHLHLRFIGVTVALFTLGILCFSGSIYVHALAGVDLGIVTPIGGVLLMLGWAALILSGLFSGRSYKR